MLNGLSWQKRGLVDFLNAMLVPRIQQLSCIDEIGFLKNILQKLFCDGKPAVPEICTMSCRP